MSINATNWVWSLRLGDATRKLIMMKYADHAHDDGRNTWVKPSTAADFAECSERTVQRHLGHILDEGYMREGDQAAYVWPKSYNGPRDDRYKPIVYDLAMDEDTRLRWKTERAAARGGRRDKAAAGGAVRYVRGDNLTPQSGEADGQVSGGDSLTPQRPEVTDDHRPEVTDDHGPEHRSGVTLVSPKGTVLQPPEKDEPSERFTAAAGAPTGRLTATIIASTGTPGAEVDLFGIVDAEVGEDEPGEPDMDAERRRIVQTLVAAYVDAATANGGHCPSGHLKALGRNVKRIVHDDNIPPEVLLVAVQQAAATGKKVIDDILVAPRGPQSSWSRPAARRAMQQSWVDMGRRLDAERARRQGGAA